MDMLKGRKGNLAAIAALLALVLYTWLQQAPQVAVLPYSEFMRELKAANVGELHIYGDRIEGAFVQALPDGRKHFVTTRVEPGFAHELDEYGVKFTGVMQTGFWTQVLSWLPFLLIVAIWMGALRGARGGRGFP